MFTFIILKILKIVFFEKIGKMGLGLIFGNLIVPKNLI